MIYFERQPLLLFSYDLVFGFEQTILHAKFSKEFYDWQKTVAYQCPNINNKYFLFSSFFIDQLAIRIKYYVIFGGHHFLFWHPFLPIYSQNYCIYIC